MKQFIAIGDSHIDMFARLCKVTCRIPGASAYGITNLNSDTRANRIISALLSTLHEYKVIISLGEVDCNSVYWMKSMSKEDYVQAAISNLSSFLSTFTQHLIISSVILPPVDDYQKTNMRPQVSATKLERTNLVYLFNSHLQKMCTNNNYHYLDITTPTANKQGLLRNKFMISKTNSHLNPNTIFPIIKKGLGI